MDISRFPEQPFKHDQEFVANYDKLIKGLKLDITTIINSHILTGITDIKNYLLQEKITLLTRHKKKSEKPYRTSRYSYAICMELGSMSLRTTNR